MTPTRILLVVSALWVLSEIVIGFARHSSGQAEPKDRLSLRVLWLGCTIGPFAGGILTGVHAATMPASLRPYAFYGGLALILLGIAIRWTSIATLKKYFTVDVAIAKDHKVIRHGVYRFVRHPSYAGTLLSFLGLGLAFCNWLSLLATATPVLLALAYRISVEEHALLAALGDEYRTYAATTKRLVPGVF